MFSLGNIAAAAEKAAAAAEAAAMDLSAKAATTLTELGATDDYENAYGDGQDAFDDYAFSSPAGRNRKQMSSKLRSGPATFFERLFN